jgi:hypothetical protein
MEAISGNERYLYLFGIVASTFSRKHLTCLVSEIGTSKYPSRTLMYSSGSMKKLCVKTVTRDFMGLNVTLNVQYIILYIFRAGLLHINVYLY